MKKTITIYELLGKVKDNKDTDIYVKYKNRMTETEDEMWACVENIIDKLDNKVIYLNDEVEILNEEQNNFTGWKMYQDGKMVMSMDCSNQDEEEFEDIEECFAGVELDYNKNSLEYKINQLIKNQKKIIKIIEDKNENTKN